MTAEVVDVPDRRRYEIRIGEEPAGFAAYVRTDDLVTFTHTEIDPAHEGRGLGGALVRGALDDVRSRGRSVLPLCPFVRNWIERHPDYADLVHRASGD
ncbi:MULTISPECIES: GNAT family N-acetyltransferase [unclassified Nocardiopsis]|uniref:GNAT family N-acetyltransferase n=1 Tax=unclassified Nocardiopsis TaxID=2649073 RepID=UPI00135A0F8D|nr:MULTISPECIES: GNAT family N-acetyltransferase [unclassified Nocardiopsis]